MKCPKCNSEILNKNINIQTDVAQCNKCMNIFKISEQIESNFDDGFDINNPPNGSWIITQMNETVVGATTKSPVAFFLVPFMLIWSGGSIGGIYGTQILSGEFDLIMSLFGIPFLIGSFVFWSFALMTIWGKVELTFDNQGGKIFTGVGNIGIVKKFIWDDIATIKEKRSNFHYPGSQGGNLVLEGKRRISFGLGVKQERQYYLYRTIKNIISKNKLNK